MNTAFLLKCAFLAFLGWVMTHGPVAAWKNGPIGNAITNTETDCTNPPYATQDWVADHARALLPGNERAWLDPHRRLLLIGTGVCS